MTNRVPIDDVKRASKELSAALCAFPHLLSEREIDLIGEMYFFIFLRLKRPLTWTVRFKWDHTSVIPGSAKVFNVIAPLITSRVPVAEEFTVRDCERRLYDRMQWLSKVEADAVLLRFKTAGKTQDDAQ